jgi:hypothetical protein
MTTMQVQPRDDGGRIARGLDRRVLDAQLAARTGTMAAVEDLAVEEDHRKPDLVLPDVLLQLDVLDLGHLREQLDQRVQIQRVRPLGHGIRPSAPAAAPPASARSLY